MVTHLFWGQEIAGSSPAVPTTFKVPVVGTYSDGLSFRERR